MIQSSIGYLLLVVGLAAIALQRLYSCIPIRELKRLAGRGDRLASSLYRAVAYGASLRLLLWSLVSITMAAGLLLTVPSLPAPAAFVLLILVAFTSFILLPSIRLTQRSAQFAAALTPEIVWILAHTHSLLDKLAVGINRFRDMPLHSRLYEKEDLLDLVNRQKDQSDNRIPPKDLELVQRALTFDDTRAADIVQPRKAAHLVDADDSIGPILLDQLHQQKQGSFLVYKDDQDNIIGSLALADAVTAKHGGRVFDLIRNDLIFVHEEFTARQVLDAFHKTGHQVAVVINNAEEFIGVITLDHLLRTLLGEASDEGMAYGDRRAVASYKPKVSAEAKTNIDMELSSDSSPEATEVVE
jgi:CBS domain containing-hemolysin-like protein